MTRPRHRWSDCALRRSGHHPRRPSSRNRAAPVTRRTRGRHPTGRPC